MDRNFRYICEICGTPLDERHCKARCPNCGRVMDCSDLPALTANLPGEQLDYDGNPIVVKGASEPPSVADVALANGQDLTKLAIHPAVLALVPAELCRTRCVLPIDFKEHTLLLAVPDLATLLDVGVRLGEFRIEPVAFPRERIEAAIEHWYG